MREVDVDGGGRGKEGDRVLQAHPGPREVARLAEGGPEECLAAARRRVELHATSGARLWPCSRAPLYHSATPRL